MNLQHTIRYSTSLLLGICLLFSGIVTGCSAAKGSKDNTVKHTLTVAKLWDEDQDGIIQVTFLQSARYYKIAANKKISYITLLKNSQETKTPVIVSRASEQSDIILSVEKVK